MFGDFELSMIVILIRCQMIALYMIKKVRIALKQPQSYGITQCYFLYRAQVNAPALTPSRQAGTRFTYPGGMEG